MNRNSICSNSEACLHFIYLKFDHYKKLLDDDQQACDQMIASIREQACAYDSEEQLRSVAGLDSLELANQLDYLEQEAFKTHEENKTCLFQMFQKLFHLHRELAFDDVLISEQEIANAFQYCPSVLPNIERLRIPSASSAMTNSDKHSLTFAATPTPKNFVPTPVQRISFSKRVDIETFQPSKESRPSIESNEIDITKLVRETKTHNPSDQFQFSNLSQNLREEKMKVVSQKKKIVHRTTPCNDALLVAANKRFVVLYNMNIANVLYLFDTEKDQTKEFQWDEGAILSLGHVDSNTFVLISATKLFLYDIVKENLCKQHFLYNTLYKDLLLMTDDLSYQTALKRHNQLSSTVFDDYCYYLYTNKEYEQLLIKCSLDNFQEEMNVNLTRKYPQIQGFLGFTVTNHSVITFLIRQSNSHQLLFCDELHNCNTIRKLPILNARDPIKIISTSLPKMNMSSSKTSRYGQQLWFILDGQSQGIHCLTEESYITKIDSANARSVQSIAVFDEKLILASNEFAVEILDLDQYFSSFSV